MDYHYTYGKNLPIKELKDYPSRRVVMLKHKTKGYYFPIIETPHSKSLMRLQQKVGTCGIDWDYHIICTFAEKHIYTSRGGKVWSDQYIIEEGEVKRLSTKLRYNKYERFSKCMKDINWVVTGSLMRELFQEMRNYGLQISYAWKYEEGLKNSRPHFHILLKFRERTTKPCAFCLYSLMNNRFWEYGRTEVVNIITKMQLEAYIKKDFSKYSNLKFLSPMKRKWSTSRDVKANPAQSKFEWDRTVDKDFGLKLFRSTKDKFIEDYNSPLYNIHDFVEDIERELMGKVKRTRLRFA
jgi:hypothetical protein